MREFARLTFKQYRFELGAAAIAAVLLGVSALLVAFRLSSIAMPPGCFEAWLDARGGVFAPDCENATRLYRSISANEADFVFGAMLLLPFIVGLIGGIPIVAREMELGTAQTAWSLTPSRSRWLGRQMVPVIAVLGIAIAFAAGAASFLESYQARTTVTHLILQGPIVVARGLAAFGLGLFVGSVVGRSLPAFLIAAVLSTALAAVADPIRVDWLFARRVPLGYDATYGYGFGYAWRAPDGTYTPWDEHTYERLIPPSELEQIADDLGEEPYMEWLVDHGYEQVQLGVPDEVARGWIPIETVGMSLIGLAGIGATVVVVNRRRPT